VDHAQRSATILAAFANTAIYGGGMKIAPHALMDDGQLDVCVVGGVVLSACLHVPRLLRTPLAHPRINYFQAARIRVETDRQLDMYADGEYVCRTPVEVNVQRGALKVLTL